MVDESDEKKIQKLESEINRLKDEIKKLNESLKNSETERNKVYRSVLEAGESNAYWNRIIGIGTILAGVLGLIGLLFQIYKYYKESKEKSVKCIRGCKKVVLVNNKSKLKSK